MIHRAVKSTINLAGPSRTRIGIRKYATQPNNAEQNKNIGEMINRKAFMESWRALPPNKKLLFGGLVALGAYMEYTLLDKYILGPVKSRKEEEKRNKLEKDLLAAGGGNREVLLVGESPLIDSHGPNRIFVKRTH